MTSCFPYVCLLVVFWDTRYCECVCWRAVVLCIFHRLSNSMVVIIFESSPTERIIYTWHCGSHHQKFWINRLTNSSKFVSSLRITLGLIIPNLLLSCTRCSYSHIWSTTWHTTGLIAVQCINKRQFIYTYLHNFFCWWYSDSFGIR